MMEERLHFTILILLWISGGTEIYLGPIIFSSYWFARFPQIQIYFIPFPTFTITPLIPSLQNIFYLWPLIECICNYWNCSTIICLPSPWKTCPFSFRPDPYIFPSSDKSKVCDELVHIYLIIGFPLIWILWGTLSTGFY
jgi:hypothetical protein